MRNSTLNMVGSPNIKFIRARKHTAVKLNIKTNNMPQFTVVLEITLEAENPLEAAKTARQWAIEDPMQYYTHNDETGEFHSVDLAENDEDAVSPCTEMPVIF